MKNWKDNEKSARMVELETELRDLEEELAEKQAEKQETEEQLEKLQREFQAVTDSKTWKLVQSPKKMKQFVRSTAAYALGRRNRKQLYSKEYKRKNAANQLKKYKYHLYNLGFEEKVTRELEMLFKETDSKYVRQAIAWELTLWYANKYTKTGARRALDYLPAAMKDVEDAESLRKAAVIKAECLSLLGIPGEGQAFMQQVLTFQEHPDLYLAAANVEVKTEKRLEWINKAMDVYGLEPVMLSDKEAETAYDNLISKVEKKEEKGPKVTVIIPAYNAENGIKTAIESILMQSWQQFELIVVDDCSPDGTAEAVKSYTEKDARIKLMSTTKNSGPYVARNIALEEATGDFVTINDSDDWSHPRKLEMQVRHLIANPNVIANTSEQARMTEELGLYRRGTPGIYIFTNMSSLMFRREPVMKKVGFWDEVRFAADSEYIKRIGRSFGDEKIVNLKTGPLSFPRQTAGSLTGSSAFGYNGFLMGARKEYAEVHRQYHQSAKTLFYGSPQKERPFPVPEPMWPKREEKHNGMRHFDIVIAGDFRLPENHLQSAIKQIKFHKQLGLRTGLIQMAKYNVKSPKEINHKIRELIDGNNIQLLVYGEKITCENLMTQHAAVLQEKQKYIPEVQTANVRVILDELPSKNGALHDLRRCAEHAADYFGKRGRWYPADEKMRTELLSNHRRESRFIKLSGENWNRITGSLNDYASHIDSWTVDENPYLF
ncbi:glycosyltransferase family 2 protein [Virgibacillus kimchii]